MFIQPIIWDELHLLNGKELILFGTEKQAQDLLKHIYTSIDKYSIKFKFATNKEYDQDSFENIPFIPLEQALDEHKLDNEIILIASAAPMPALNQLVDAAPKEIYLCNKTIHDKFAEGPLKLQEFQSQKEVTPFDVIEGSIPKIKSLVTNGFVSLGDNIDTIEVADFYAHEYTSWKVPQSKFPLSLKDFSSQIPTNTLPMRMSHLSYLFWKYSIHVAQMSPSRRYLVAARYNFFFLDILDTKTGIWKQWHDLPPEQGLWDYVATGDYDNESENYYFVRWPLADAIQGMIDGTNKVHCQVGKLNLETLKAEIIHEFDFQDRIHQCTISGDGRYMVFAPMRVLRPEGDPKKIKPEDLMRNLQKSVKLDSMATMDLKTGKVWYTKIPFPIPAHFELDPYDPHVFYVSTHSLLPHAEGVICFQPGSIHKMLILDGETVIESTYSHKSFVRTTQHCVFAYKGKTLIAATNQNKVEIIDGETMTLWHCYKLADDPMYDNADFNNPEFLSKPFSLPAFPAHCDSISASGDGQYLILRLHECYAVYDIENKKLLGKVKFRSCARTSSHSRYYMQNAPFSILTERYAAIK